MSDAEVKDRLITILHELDTHSGLNHPSQQLGLTRDQGLGLSLFASCRSLLRSISFLLREDHGEEATILMRTLLQDATTLFYIFKNQPTTVEMTLRFEYGSMKEERKLLVEALKHSPDQDTEEGIAILDGQIEETKVEAKQINIDLQPLPRMQQMLDELKLSEGYFFFRYASHAVHTSRLALAARMKDGEEGQVVVDFGGTPELLLTVGLFSGELFANAYRAVARLLAWEAQEQIDDFAQHKQTDFLTLREDAGVTTRGFGQS